MAIQRHFETCVKEIRRQNTPPTTMVSQAEVIIDTIREGLTGLHLRERMTYLQIISQACEDLARTSEVDELEFSTQQIER